MSEGPPPGLVSAADQEMPATESVDGPPAGLMPAGDAAPVDLGSIEPYELLPAEAPDCSCFEGLDPEQRQAVAHGEGPCRLLAGAGSGKTRALTHRAAHLVHRGVPAARILCVTFTRRAAGEMEARLDRLGVGGDEGVRVGTWHKLCRQIMHGEGLPEAKWLVAEDEHAARVLRDAVGWRGARWDGADFAAVEGAVGLCKARLAGPGSRAAAEIAGPLVGDVHRFQQAYAAYERLLKEERLITFDDFLVLVCRILRDREARERWQGRWDFVLQDEAQDANFAQRQAIECLARGSRNYMAVGDFSQCVFAFRGSEPQLLADFEDRWPDAAAIVMNRNYRSRAEITAAADRVIARAALPPAAPMVAHRGEGGAVRVVACADADDEARRFADWVERERMPAGKGVVPWRAFVALYRTNAQSRALEDELGARHIPYNVSSNRGFYDRREVRALLAYLAIAAGEGSVEDVKACINAPARYLGKAFIDKLPKKTGDWPADVERASEASGVQKRQRESAKDWSMLVRSLSDAALAGDAPERLLETVLDRTGYLGWLERLEGSGNADSRPSENVRELVRVSARHKTCADLFAYVRSMRNLAAAARTVKEPGNRVSLLTIHACVSPATLVETQSGLETIAEARASGVVATAEGASEYEHKVSYEARPMLRITTKSGYFVEVTEDHGLMAFDRSTGLYTRKLAAHLRRGDFLRLKLGACIDVSDVHLPEAPEADVRAHRYRVPRTVDVHVAELFGLMVADGTVFRGGFRLTKRHRDVVQRFVDLVAMAFEAESRVQSQKNKFMAEVSSTFLSAWLHAVGGMMPRQKAVPDCILRSSLASQAAFLRGLFEDGTVNVSPTGRLDHVSWTTSRPRVAEIVQVMLLRFGVISARKPRFGYWRIEISGTNAHKFRDAIGFVSGYKNGLLRCPTGLEEGYVVPIRRDDLPPAGSLEYGSRAHWARQNARHRGYVSRHGASLLGLERELVYHHDRIARIESFVGPAMCVAVPCVGRFLQNGFDGCNSKGLEWERVWICGAQAGLLPHEKGEAEEERRLMYVAMTRAKDELVLSYVEGKEPSPYLAEAGIALEKLSVQNTLSFGDEKLSVQNTLSLEGEKLGVQNTPSFGDEKPGVQIAPRLGAREGRR